MRRLIIIITLAVLASCQDPIICPECPQVDTIYQIDTLYQTDTIVINQYVDNQACFFCVKDSFQMWLPSYNTFVTFYTLTDRPEDTIRIQREENIFWIANYTFKDTTIIRYRIRDSLVTYINYVDTSKFTVISIVGKSTICNGQYGTPTLKINGSSDKISGGGMITLDDVDREYLFNVGIGRDKVETISVEWYGDCNNSTGDRNVFLKSIEIKGVNYLTPDRTTFTGGVKWWSVYAYFYSNGSLIITL